MITATFRENLNTGAISLKVKGHALSAPEGEDLICAAATAYAHQALQTARNMSRDNWLLKEPIVTARKGYVYLSILPKEEYRVMVFNMIQTIATGFSILESKYPKYVTLTTFGNA